VPVRATHHQQRLVVVDPQTRLHQNHRAVTTKSGQPNRQSNAAATATPVSRKTSQGTEYYHWNATLRVVVCVV